MYLIEEIFDRANIQDIRCLLLDGIDNPGYNGTYEERLKEAEQPVKELLDRIAPPHKQDSAMDIIFRYATLTQEVYMEIGLKCGASYFATAFGTIIIPIHTKRLNESNRSAFCISPFRIIYRQYKR